LLGLKTHKCLVAKDGANFVYLSPLLLSVASQKHSPFLVKVSTGPVLLGLDVMSRFNMELFVKNKEYFVPSESTTPNEFQHIDFPSLMHKFELKANDLMPIEKLPEPEIAYKEMVKLGKLTIHMEDSLSYLNVPQVPIFDLGTS
jgi:hypothetical protein